MNSDIFMGLVNNAALLLALAVLYDTFPLQKRPSHRANEILTGILLGIIGMAIMLTPWRFSPGVSFDTRSILLSMTGLFFGMIPTLIAAAMTCALRVAQGGSGAFMGIGVLLTSASLGLAWRYFLRFSKKMPRWYSLYGFGVVVHVTMLLWILALPQQLRAEVFKNISLPVMLIYPIGTVLLGLLLIRQRQQNEWEQELRQERDLIAQISETSLDAILLTSPDGSIEAANPAACNMFGRTAEEIIRIGRSGIVDTTDPRLSPALEERARSGSFIGELKFIRKEGQKFAGEVASASFKDKEGRERISMIIRDITARKQAEDRLRESEEKYRELFISMIDGFALHEIICDEDGKPVDYRFLEVNPAYERLTGFRSENLINRTALEVMPKTEPYWIEIYGNVALTGRSTFYENYAGDPRRHFEVSVYCPRPGQFAVIAEDITERKQSEADTRQRMTELEMLYQSGLELSQLLNPKEIGKKILELLEEKLGWHHTGILFYHLQDDKMELLDFNQPDFKSKVERLEAVERLQMILTRCMSDWAIQQGKPVRAGDVSVDPSFIETYPGIRSGLYVPMKLGEHIVGVISIEDERPDAFSEADERLIATLANQAASAFENARLFEETRQRVMELETINRISLTLRSVSKQNEVLSIVLNEALSILTTLHGSIQLYNRTTDSLEKIAECGWFTQVIEPSQNSGNGIAGKVFTSGEAYISREFANDPEVLASARSLIPSGWGGICLPIRTTQQTLGVMIVSVPSERELNKNESRLLSILSELTGAALQRMQLHEQTVRRMEQLNALRGVDQAITSNLDLRLTLNILFTHTISQLGVDAVDVLLLHPGSNLLELVAGHGFHTLLFESVSLSASIARRAVMEHQTITVLDFETANQNLQFGKFWKEEEFACYWCVPLIVKGEVKGVLEVYRRAAFTPDSEWLEFLEALAGQTAIAIDNAQLFENLQRANMDLSLAYEATIEGWSRAMDLRDHETEGHTLRVTDLTMKLAYAMHVNESQLIAIRRGALLHDIGKMGVPDAILLKEGKLTDGEWEIMHRHPEYAYNMLAPIEYLHPALEIPYCHHEKWIGTGYPRGLKGEEIPLTARIFAIVDVWDALTNDRPYRPAWSKEKTLDYIREQSGNHFDPKVVDAFLKLLKKTSQLTDQILN